MLNDLEKLLVFSADFAHAPIELRERFAFGDADPQPAALLARMPGVAEAFWFESCDRVEAAFLANSESEALAALADLLWQHALVDIQSQEQTFVTFRGSGAIQHLVGTLCGLDTAFPNSLHLRSAFRESWRRSWESGGVQDRLHRLCQSVTDLAAAITPDLPMRLAMRTAAKPCGACVRAFTGVATEAALTILHRRFGNLSERRALVMGAGPLATMLAEDLRAEGVELAIADAYPPVGRELANEVRGRWVMLGRLRDECRKNDILIAAAPSRRRLFTAEDMVSGGTDIRARVMLDFAFPRAIDPEISEWGVSVFNVDEIARISQTVSAERRSAEIRRSVDQVLESALRPEGQRAESQVIALA